MHQIEMPSCVTHIEMEHTVVVQESSVVRTATTHKEEVLSLSSQVSARRLSILLFPVWFFSSIATRIG